MEKDNQKKNPVAPAGQLVQNNGSPSVKKVNSGVHQADATNEEPKGPGSSSGGVPVFTRAEAEAKYSKLLDSPSTIMDTLETAVQVASNTKLEIKTAVKSMGAHLRDFTALAKRLGMVRNPDATELRVRQVQQQLVQQHAQTLNLLKEIREEQ
ncbi:CCHC-type domain-containing protein, partial [Aphis craccivora]